MTRLWLTFCSFWLLLLAISGQAETRHLRFVDQNGKPIPDVTVSFSYRADLPHPSAPGRSGAVRSDSEGRVTLIHPCGISTGSCCALVTPISYSISKLGYQFSPSTGSVPCQNPLSVEVTVAGIGTEFPKLATVSAANYKAPLTTEMLAVSFGSNLATQTEASQLPLPTLLAGRRIVIVDELAKEHLAFLLFVSPTQINFVVPAEVASGLATLALKDASDQILGVSFITVLPVSPGIFTANADGQGVPAAVILRVRANGSQEYEPVAQFDATLRRFVPLALDLGPDSEFVVLSLFGTGWRQVRSIAEAEVTIGGVDCPVEYAGKQPTIEGLDQINVRLLRTLIGMGDVTVEVKFGSASANRVQLKIK